MLAIFVEVNQWSCFPALPRMHSSFPENPEGEMDQFVARDCCVFRCSVPIKSILRDVRRYLFQKIKKAKRSVVFREKGNYPIFAAVIECMLARPAEKRKLNLARAFNDKLRVGYDRVAAKRAAVLIGRPRDEMALAEWLFFEAQLADSTFHLSTQKKINGLYRRDDLGPIELEVQSC